MPNHVAPDHAWTTEHPEWFVRGTTDDLAADPAAFLAIGDAVIARGRDPYFPPWPDVVQLDASLPALREAAAAEVAAIAERCDGVRCDMAMLVLDDIFVRTWGDRAGGRPGAGRRAGVLADGDGGRAGGSPRLRVLGRGVLGPRAATARGTASTPATTSGSTTGSCTGSRRRRSAPTSAPTSATRPTRSASSRTTTSRGWRRRCRAPAARAAAVVALTLPGVALLHEGQEVGRRIRVPVTLGRRPDEAPDTDLDGWYGRLRTAIGAGMRRGEWALVDVEGWPDNRSCEHLVAWTWIGPDARFLVVVNLSDDKADGRIRLGAASAAPIVLTDALTGDRYLRDGAAVGSDGLYVALAPHGAHVLAW